MERERERVCVCSGDFGSGSHKPCFICTVCFVLFFLLVCLGAGGGVAHRAEDKRKAEDATKVLLTCEQNVEENTEKLMQDREGLSHYKNRKAKPNKFKLTLEFFPCHCSDNGRPVYSDRDVC